MIELESKKNVERNVYLKTEEEKMSNMRNDVSKKSTKIEEMEKEVNAKLERKIEELKEIE